MSDIDWDSAPKGYPVWIVDLANGVGEWFRDDGGQFTAQDDSFWSKPEEGYYEVFYNPLTSFASELYADLKTAAAQLRKYEELHRAKGTEDSLAKAEVNAELASRFEATLAKARGEV